MKSPATTSPPNETLLTINDQGDVWIKGQLYEYPTQSTITLDPSRKYWTIRDATGKVVWALEVYNPSTGASWYERVFPAPFLETRRGQGSRTPGIPRLRLFFSIHAASQAN